MLENVARNCFFIGIAQCTCIQQQRVLTVTQKVLFGEQVFVNVRFSHFWEGEVCVLQHFNPLVD